MIEAVEITKQFNPLDAPVIKGVSFQIAPGEFVSIWGRSGSGKTTLLYILSTLDRPTSGDLRYHGQSVTAMSESEILALRNQKMGFIFQFHYLMGELSALENVLLPARKQGLHRLKRAEAEHLLAQVGLAEKRHRLPSQLSGGEQQRVAIARALIMNPEYIFADEPTGSLDTANAERVMELLRERHEKQKTTLILVTHEEDFAKQAQRRIVLKDGFILHDETLSPHP